MSTGAITPALTDADLVEMTLEKAAAAFAQGMTAEELTKAFLERVFTYNPAITPSSSWTPACVNLGRIDI